MDNRVKPMGTGESTAICWGVAALAGVAIFALLLLLGGWTILQAIFGGSVVAAVVGVVLTVTIGRPQAAPVGQAGAQAPTAPIARAKAPGTAGMAGDVADIRPRDLSAPSPHRTEIPQSKISDTWGPQFEGADAKPASTGLQGEASTRTVEPAPATRIPAPAPINADDPAVARPVGATSDPKPLEQPAPLDGRVVSPEAPEPIDPTRAAAPPADRNTGAEANHPEATTGPAPTADASAQSYNEAPRADLQAASGTAPAAKPAAKKGLVVHDTPGTKPATLDAPEGGTADDLKMIKGVGPKLEKMLNGMGFWHFRQVAAWTDQEVAWVDQNLDGFKGRVTRDEWVPQAKVLAEGGTTEFSTRAGKGGVY
jgi:predicted flap endonuclease-1-like 5' DNA nuclease